MKNTETNHAEAPTLSDVVEQSDEKSEQQRQVENKEQMASSDVQIQELTAKLKDTESKAADYQDQVLRAKAEVENMRRRMERDVEKAHKFALEGFAQELLGVVDSLELGLVAANEESATIEKLKEGKELTLRLLRNAMEKFNIKEINPVNAPFNPELHQAMTMQESSEQEPNTVLLVFQKGYLLNDRLIRPARVVVAKAPAPASESPPTENNENN